MPRLEEILLVYIFSHFSFLSFKSVLSYNFDFFFKVEKDPIFFHKGIFFFGKIVFPSIDRVKYMATWKNSEEKKNLGHLHWDFRWKKDNYN